jgi:hypothetical protein
MFNEVGAVPSHITQEAAPTSPPACVISLDFELRWGMYDRLGLNGNAYRKNLENARAVVPSLLKLFSSCHLRVTWACVGALACGGWGDYFRRAPRPPRYRNRSLIFDQRFAEMDPGGSLHFAPDLMALINSTPGQELGTHTFSHLCMGEPGVTAEDVSADLQAVGRLWTDRFGRPPRSLVFPRNQVAFLDVIRRSSIRIWRGNPPRWYYGSARAAFFHRISRGFRLCDALIFRNRLAAPLEGDMTRASLFLRLNLPQPAWLMHRGRILGQLDMLRENEVFHFYWHPHNLGDNPRARLARVAEILELIAERCERRKIVSKNMGDLVPGD